MNITIFVLVPIRILIYTSTAAFQFGLQINANESSFPKSQHHANSRAYIPSKLLTSSLSPAEYSFKDSYNTIKRVNIIE